MDVNFRNCTRFAVFLVILAAIGFALLTWFLHYDGATSLKDVDVSPPVGQAIDANDPRVIWARREQLILPNGPISDTAEGKAHNHGR